MHPGETGDEPKFQFVTRVIDVGPEQGGDATLGKLTLSARYADSEGDTYFLVAVYAGKKELHRGLYQFVHDHPPGFEFAGGHGFTGLVYVAAPDGRGDYQYSCEVSRSDRARGPNPE